MTAWRGGYKLRKNASKYGNHTAVIAGEIFDSKKEAKRWKELLLLVMAGEITDLERQKKFVLIPAQREPDRTGPKGGIIKGAVIERECSYYADFTYKVTETGELVVEDTKGGVRTPEYIIKRKLMLERYGIRIREL